MTILSSGESPARGHNSHSLVCIEVEKAWAANKAKNEASRDEARAKKELTVLMAEAMGDSDEFTFRHQFVHNGRSIAIVVIYARSEREGVDIRKLESLVPRDTFLDIITASKARITEVAGSNIANLCVAAKTGNYIVSIKEVK